MMKILALLLLLASYAWAGQTTRFLWMPNRAMDGDDVGGNMAGMRCGGYVPSEGITGATQIAWYVSGSHTSGKCGVAIYDAPGTLQIATTTGLDCSGPGVKLATGITPFDLFAGMKYNVCICGNGSMGSGTYLTWLDGGQVDDVARSFSGKVWRAAANNCDSNGVPPSMTGSLTDSSYAPPTVLIGTGTP